MTWHSRLIFNSLNDVKEAEIIINSYSDEQTIFVDFIDNGCGIPESIQKDIFNPFFTTMLKKVV